MGTLTHRLSRVGTLAFAVVLFFSSSSGLAVEPPPMAPPTPKKCNSETRSVDLTYWSNYRFNIPSQDHGDSYSLNCNDHSRVQNGILRYRSGQISTTCNDGSFTDPVQNCVVDEVDRECLVSISPGVTKEEISQAYQDAGRTPPAALLNEMPAATLQPGVAKVTVTCGSKYQSDDQAVALRQEGEYAVSGIAGCTNATSGLCYLDPNSSLGSKFYYYSNGDRGPLLKTPGGGYESKSIFYIWNKASADDRNLAMGTVTFSHRYEYGVWRDLTTSQSGALVLEGIPAEATSCELKVSGATSAYTATQPPSVNVSNDVLVFRANLVGGSGAIGSIITYSGGPDASTGVWTNPPLGKTSTVTATVKTPYTKKEFKCSLSVTPQGTAAVIKLRRFGDCSYFNALRSYYYMDASGSGYQSTGYSSPISIPGVGAKYGLSSADVPFRGVVNAAAATSGEIVMGLGGKVTLPPLEKRPYSKAVVVGKVFKGGAKVAAPVYYGTLDLNDYSITQLYRVPGSEAPLESDSIVFQAYLAGSQPSDGRDLRGTSAGLPYHEFAPTTQDGRPWDRIVPFVNDSCVPLFQVSTPGRKDKSFPSELSSVTQCMYSRPHSVADVEAGRVDLTLLHISPEHAHHQFPSELFKASSQPICRSKNESNTVKCYDIKASSMGVAANADPFSSHDLCRTVTTEWVTQTTTSASTQSCTQYGNSSNSDYRCITVPGVTTTTQIPITRTTYKASCPILETKSECSKNLAIRFSGYNQMMIAALGCAVKYENSIPAGDLVTATLKGAGVIPYTSQMGGSAPRSYQSYPPTYGASNGYACIPCRFGSQAAAAGINLVDDTGELNVDQDQTVARKPIFSFTTSKAPADCVREVEFEVRYFGSQECNGVNAPQGHFCTSSNLGGQNCSASDGKGGGNIAGKFKVPVCPNSGFEYDNVSVSWSPMLVDVRGNGIEISRDPQYGVHFDIRGTGKKRLIDWPMNTSEVAFLVLPNKDGQVTSIKELFGDYKAKDGFAALAKHDANKDRIIDSKDKVFAKLQLWFDHNRNGVQDSGELASLKDYGVSQIHLQHRRITNKGTEGRTLSSVYYNSKYREYLNVGDYYFNDYSGK